MRAYGGITMKHTIAVACLTALGTSGLFACLLGGCDQAPAKPIQMHFEAAGYVRQITKTGAQHHAIVFEGENKSMWTITVYDSPAWVPPVWVNLRCVVSYDRFDSTDKTNFMVVRRLD